MLEIKDEKNNEDGFSSFEKSTNELLYDVCKSQREMIKNMRNMCIVTIVSFCLIICTMIVGFFYYESQFDYVETVTTTTATDTDMETSGENANINNVNDGDMYNDNATHNE
jgi:hypothetical protein